MKIKFRVWDKRNNRMIKPKKFATVIPVLDFNGNLGVMDTYKNWHWYGIVPENEYELMLFIGSHDKNGKEIYEVDIVLYDSPQRYRYSKIQSGLGKIDTFCKKQSTVLYRRC